MFPKFNQDNKPPSFGDVFIPNTKFTKFVPVDGTDEWKNTTIAVKYHSITFMKFCERVSFEELRWADYKLEKDMAKFSFFNSSSSTMNGHECKFCRAGSNGKCAFDNNEILPIPIKSDGFFAINKNETGGTASSHTSNDDNAVASTSKDPKTIANPFQASSSVASSSSLQTQASRSLQPQDSPVSSSLKNNGSNSKSSTSKGAVKYSSARKVIESITATVSNLLELPESTATTSRPLQFKDSNVASKTSDRAKKIDYLDSILPIILHGLNAPAKEKLLQKNISAEHCLLKAPNLNAEIDKIIRNEVKNSDKNLQERQDQLGYGIATILKAVSLFLEEQRLPHGIQMLFNACKILADIHYDITKDRMEAIASTVDTSVFAILMASKRDSTLFGNNLKERIDVTKLKMQSDKGKLIDSRRNTESCVSSQESVPSKERSVPSREPSVPNRGTSGLGQDILVPRQETSNQSQETSVPNPDTSVPSQDASVPSQQYVSQLETAVLTLEAEITKLKSILMNFENATTKQMAPTFEQKENIENNDTDSKEEDWTKQFLFKHLYQFKNDVEIAISQFGTDNLLKNLDEQIQLLSLNNNANEQY